MKKYIKTINMIFGCNQYNKLFRISLPNFITSLKEIDGYNYNIIFYNCQNYNNNYKYNGCYVWKFENKEISYFGSWILFHSYNQLLILLKEFINFFETYEKL